MVFYAMWGDVPEFLILQAATFASVTGQSVTIMDRRQPQAADAVVEVGIRTTSSLSLLLDTVTCTEGYPALPGRIPTSACLALSINQV